MRQAITPAADDEPEIIEIRHRTVVSRDGTERTSGYADCPRLREIVSLRNCLTCEHFKGFRGPERGAPSQLACVPGVCAAPHAPKDARAHEDASGATRTPVTHIMTDTVVCVRDDLDIDALMALFVERGVNGVPVVGERGDPIGIVSRADVIREYYATSEHEPGQVPFKPWDYDLGPLPHAHALAETTVADIMMPIVFTLPEDATVADAARLMAVKGVHQLPVLSSRGEVIGIVSSLDIMAWVALGSTGVGPAGGTTPFLPRD
jgi:CBS domain-containing protein